ncbi:MAG: glutamyl-tRNA reductase [Verrucomicrobiota bacterium]
MPGPRLVCGGISFHEAPVEVLEKVSFAKENFPLLLPQLQQELRLDEIVLLSTCNRVEFFAVAQSDAIPSVQWPEFLQRYHAISEDLSSHTFCVEGTACVEHLFEVASGLQSMVVGETEIFGQIKDAYETANTHKTTGKWLHKLFQSSFNAAKEVRSQTAITRGSVSVGSVSVELAEKIFGSLKTRKALVIGAGDTSEKTARALQSRGISDLYVTNRTLERAELLAHELQGHAIPWESWKEKILEIDILISSTTAPDFVLHAHEAKSLIKQRRGKPLFLIDLAIPRDFDPQINELDDLYLYNLDDLQKISSQHLQDRGGEIEKARQILRPHVHKLIEWIANHKKIIEAGIPSTKTTEHLHPRRPQN